MQQQNLTREELFKVQILCLPPFPCGRQNNSGALRSWGSLGPCYTVGRAFWDMSPGMAVTWCLGGTVLPVSAPSSSPGGLEAQHKWQGSHDLLYGGCLGFSVCTNYQPRLIPATQIALQSAVDLIIPAILFLLLSVLSEKATCCSPLPAVTVNLPSPIPVLKWCCASPVTNLQLLQECLAYILEIHFLPLDLMVF